MRPCSTAVHRYPGDEGEPRLYAISFLTLKL